ncbi:MAG: ArsR family transcriptional regulator [Infirmifilum sp.]
MPRGSERSKRLQDLSAILSAISNPYRVMILELLEKGAKRYGDIAVSVGVTQAALAHHLKKLESQGLIEHQGEVYTITPLGRKILSIVESVDFVTAHETRVVTGFGFSLPLEEYLELVLPPGSSQQGCNKKKLLRVIVREIKELGDLSDGVAQLVVDSIAQASAVRLGCSLTTACRMSIWDGPRLTGKALEFLGESGLYDLVKSNLILFDSLWEEGAASVFLPAVSVAKLKSLLSRAEFFPDIVLRLSPDDKGLVNYILDILPVAGTRNSLTLLLDLSDGEEHVKHVMSNLESSSLPNRILFILQGWEKASDDLTQHLSRLINKGLQIVFAARSIFPSGGLRAHANEDTVVLHLGTMSFLMPFVYDRVKGVWGVRDFVSETLSILERNMLSLKKLSVNVAKLLELEAGGDLSYIFQLSLAGFEAGLQRRLPQALDTNNFENYKHVLITHALDVLENMRTLEATEDVKTLSTFFTPTPFLNMLTALHYKGNIYLNVNQLGAFSLNREIRTPPQFLELESKLQSSLKAPLSILELRVTRLTPERLREILSEVQRKGIKQFTITVTGLSMCNTCGSILPSKVSRCPRCYSLDISELVKPNLYYIKRERLDPWTREEVEKRLLADGI